MSVVNKNTLGAGDGIQQTLNGKKQRAQIPSSRRFATRGSKENPLLKQKLQEALDNYVTPPQSPLGKRSQSIAEITPSKKLQGGGVAIKSKASSNHSNEGSVCKLSVSGIQRSNNNEKWRMDDAGRRVSHQLVLNAWRRRRRQVASLIESRDRLQTQVDQLQIQVNVLQKLRESEGRRRSEAVGENKAYQVTISEMEEENIKLKQSLEALQNREAVLEESIDKITVDLMNERNLSKTVAQQKALCEESFARERQQLKGVRDERNRLLNKIELCEKEIETAKSDYKLLEDVIKMTENKYEDSLVKIKELENRNTKLDEKNTQQNESIKEVESLLNGAKIRISRLECKIHDLKKLITSLKQQKKSLDEENGMLKNEINELENVIIAQREKAWWKSTGEFVLVSLENFAHILFPALPPAVKYPPSNILQSSSTALICLDTVYN